MKFVYLIVCLFFTASNANRLSEDEIRNYRDIARRMFYHAYDGYMKYAFPFDELRPLTCDGHDTWGSYSLTLIDALDTLAILGNSTEFQKVTKIVLERANYESDINVSVFETNIRIVGGLVSAHLMSKRMGVELEEGWPCNGPLLRLAETVAKKLLPAFHSKTGMPFGTVNFVHGVPYGETPITCTAGVGTFLVEFGALSRLTGDPIYEKAAMRAMLAAWRQRSSLNLLGNHIDVMTGKWTALDAGIGAGVDSYFEYLVKGSALLQRPELMQIFNSAREAIDKYLRHDDWHLWVTMSSGHVTMPVFQSLEAFWPGVLTLAGDVESAQKTLFNYHQVWRQYGFTPESYNIPQGEAAKKREGYPLRPELIESLVYMHRATGDHTFLRMGADLLLSIEHSAKTKCGYATVKNVVTHTLENRMESFFLAETTKYFYLLFSPDHWMHNDGSHGTLWTKGNRRCILDAGGYIFNSEAHPVDPGALECCSPPPSEVDQEDLWMGMTPQEVAEVILNPEKDLDYGIHKHNLHRDILVERGDLKEGEVQPEEEAHLTPPGAKDVFELKKKLTLGGVKKVPDTGFDLPKFGEDGNLDGIKRKVDDVMNEYNRQSRYRNINTKPKIIKLPDKKESVQKFDASYDSKEKEYDEAIITQTQITDEDKKLEVDSNLTQSGAAGNDQSAAENKKDTTLNLPRFGAIVASAGDNTSNRGIVTPVGESSGITTSVSSSKYSPPSVIESVGSLVVKEIIEPMLKKSPRSMEVSGPCLRDQIEIDLKEYRNFTSSASYALLSCPHPKLSDLITYKGQVIG